MSAEKPLAMVAVSGTAYDLTHGKFLLVAELLQRAGVDVLVLTWTSEAFNAAKEKQFFTAAVDVRDELTTTETRLVTSKESWGLLGWPISEQRGAPTWARLLALDDILGGVGAWKLGNLGAVRPDVIVKANQGAESSIPVDEHMEIALGRFARNNNIPTIALEVQRADDVLRLKWPMRMLLTKQDVLAAPGADETWPLPASQRYMCEGLADSYLEGYLEHEPELRVKYDTVGKRVVFVPFHLYYMQECMEALTEIATHVRELEGWAVIVGCGENFRRSYKERDIIDRGLLRGWGELGTIQIAENPNTMAVALMADVIVVPYKSQLFQLAARRYGLNVVMPGEEKTVAQALQDARRTKGVAEAVREVLKEGGV